MRTYNSNRVHIERRGPKRILAHIPYWNGRGTEMAKVVPGVAPLWDKSGEKDKFIGWTYPLDLEVCRIMREVFGEMLEIGPELHAWATAEAAREKGQLELRSAGSAELPEGFAERAPRLAKAFASRPYQSVGVSFIHEGRNVILGDDMGLGKTLQTLGALEAAAASRVLVFCKKTAMRLVWEEETLRWLPEARVFVCEGTVAERQATIAAFNEQAAKEESLTLLVCNTEMVRISASHIEGKRYETSRYPELFDKDNPWHAVVVDESHRALIGKSHLSQSAKGISQTRLGMIRLPVADGGQKIALSGTPFRGKILNIWGTLNWLRPDVFTSYWNFAKMYFTVDEGEYGLVVNGEDLREDAEEAFDRMLAPYLLRRSKAEAAPDLPAKVYPGTPLVRSDPDSPVGVWIDLGPKQRKAYKAVCDDGLVQLDGGKLMVDGTLAELTRQRQFATSYGMISAGQFFPVLPSAKLEWIMEFLDGMRGSESKVIISSQFTKIVNLFARELQQEGYENYVLTGETPQKRRVEIVRNFRNLRNPVQVILINTMAGGESITLDSADYVIMIDETHVPDDQLQVEDRAHRVSRGGNRLPVTVYYLRARDTVEADIAVACDARYGACQRALDGARGLEVIRRGRAAAVADPAAAAVTEKVTAK